jgi:hypothetical protein
MLSERFPTFLLLCSFFLPFPGRGPLTAWAKERERSENSAESIKENPTFHQRVEGFPLSLSPGEMEALLDDLPYASSLLDKYKIHSLTVVRRGDGYAADDHKGVEGTFRLRFMDGSLREYQGSGTIDNSLIGRISAEVVAAIHYTPVEEHLVRNDLEFWVLVNNSLIDFLCRLFNPLLKGALRSNVEFLVFTSQQLAVAVRSSGEEVLTHF